MARSVKKGPFVDGHLMKKVIAAKETKSNKALKEGGNNYVNA